MEETELQRGQFTFYGSYYTAINRLPKSRQLELFQAICRYAIYGELPRLTGASAAVFDMVVPNLRASRSKAAARLKELEDVENFDVPAGSDKNKDKNKFKYNHNGKEKEKEKNNSAACAADPASCCGERVFDRFCADEPILQKALRNYVGTRQSIGETVSQADAERLYRKLQTYPEEQRLSAVEYSTCFYRNDFDMPMRST